MKAHVPIIVIFLLLFAGCQQKTGPLKPVETNEARALTTTELKLVDADQTFGFDLMQRIVQMDTSANVFISPLSVSFAFGMALNGAQDSTYNVIRDVLALQGLSESEINASYRSLMEWLIGLDEKVLFEIANSIWYRNGFPVLQPFLDINQKYFNAVVRSLDFNQPEAVDIINNWVNEKTHGKIDRILYDIPRNAVMYLINAIYFKATWLYAFDKSLTSDDNFYIDQTTTVPCKMMKTTAELPYFIGDQFSAVTLPYGHDFYQMTIIMPTAEMDVDAFAASFSAADWISLLAAMETGKGTVELPKFKAEYNLLMNDVLIAMGMGVPFSPSADFGRIVADGGIFISRVIHKTFVQVDEEGTEAAAVTLIEYRSSTSDLAFFMKINRPFYFIIHEKKSHAILFMGKMKCPRWMD